MHQPVEPAAVAPCSCCSSLPSMPTTTKTMVTMESMMMKKRSMMQLLQACSSSLAARQRTREVPSRRACKSAPVAVAEAAESFTFTAAASGTGLVVRPSIIAQKEAAFCGLILIHGRVTF